MYKALVKKSIQLIGKDSSLDLEITGSIPAVGETNLLILLAQKLDRQMTDNNKKC